MQKKNQNLFPRAVKAIFLSNYMDGSIDSIKMEEDAMQLYRKVVSLWEATM